MSTADTSRSGCRCWMMRQAAPQPASRFAMCVAYHTPPSVRNYSVSTADMSRSGTPAAVPDAQLVLHHQMCGFETLNSLLAMDYFWLPLSVDVRHWRRPPQPMQHTA